jgi:hypothetical protein
MVKAPRLLLVSIGVSPGLKTPGTDHHFLESAGI